MFGVYVRLFRICVDLYLGRGLATGRSLVQGAQPIVYRSKEKNDLDTVRVRYKGNGYKKYSDDDDDEEEEEEECVCSIIPDVLGEGLQYPCNLAQFIAQM
jgi:hypothetical protein